MLGASPIQRKRRGGRREERHHEKRKKISFGEACKFQEIIARVN